MKIAIVHDGFFHIGGAEKVLFELIKIYPNADIFIPIINKKYLPLITKESNGKIHTTFFSSIPFFYKQASFIKPLLIFYWEKLDLSAYDLVITSSHSFNSKLISTAKNAIHLSYVHTPPRYLSHSFNEMQFIKTPFWKMVLAPLMNWLKKKDFQSGQKPTVLIANSQTVRERIKKTYKRNSLVIHPPIDIPTTDLSHSEKKYYLVFSRLVKQKGIQLAIETCNMLQKPLIVVGTGPELDALKKIAQSTITFTGFLQEKDLKKIFSQTKALINCAIEEDFGMVNVEAASYGIPVIGFFSGGQKETIINKKTGIFFYEHTVESLSEALFQFEKANIQPSECVNFSKQFSKKLFTKKIDRIVTFLTKKL